VIKWGVEKTNPPGVYEIRAQWDSEAGVWVAESEDVPGLVAEADSPNVLVQKLRTLIPELLELNGELLELNGAASGRTASFHVLYQHEDSGVLTF
jgi:predicted RNase H-like HicB family nuclease